MTGNRAVVYLEAGHVEVRDTPFPKLELQDGRGKNPANVGRKAPHGVIVEVITTNICGCRPTYGPWSDDSAFRACSWTRDSWKGS